MKIDIFCHMTPPKFLKAFEKKIPSQIANDEMAELVQKYPDRFVGAVACLPLNDVDASTISI